MILIYKFLCLISIISSIFFFDNLNIWLQDCFLKFISILYPLWNIKNNSLNAEVLLSNLAILTLPQINKTLSTNYGSKSTNALINYNINNNFDIIQKSNLSSYLAGLIESDINKQQIVIWGTNISSTIGWGKFTKIQREMIKFPSFQYSVIIGIILSDGSLSLSNNKSKNARLRLKQSYSHKEYLWFTFLILNHYCNMMPVCRKAIWKGSVNYSIEFTTRSLPCFTELYNLFYPKGIKIVPENIYELLTPIALAHLIMGDGNYSKGGGLLLCTDSLYIKDIIKIMNVFIIRYNFKCSLREHNKGQFRIYISKKSMKELITIVKPYMHSSFNYKLGLN